MMAKHEEDQKAAASSEKMPVAPWARCANCDGKIPIGECSVQISGRVNAHGQFVAQFVPVHKDWPCQNLRSE